MDYKPPSWIYLLLVLLFDIQPAWLYRSRTDRDLALILPIRFAAARRSVLYNPYKDIRKNIFHHYAPIRKKNTKSRIGYYFVTEVSARCGYPYSHLQGTIVCAECQYFTRHQRGKRYCNGRGKALHTSRFYDAVDTACFGKWEKIYFTKHGSCDPDSDKSFVLI